MSVFSFPLRRSKHCLELSRVGRPAAGLCRLLFAKNHLRKLDCRCSRVERSPETSTEVSFTRPMGLRLRILGHLPGFEELSACRFCSANSQQSQIVNNSNAATRLQYACYRNCTSLLCLAYATASVRCTSQLRVQLFALATRTVIDADESRERRGTVPRYLARAHTLRTRIFGKTDAPALSFAARGNLTE